MRKFVHWNQTVTVTSHIIYDHLWKTPCSLAHLEHAHTHKHARTHTHIHKRVRARTHARTHACTHARTHARTHTHTRIRAPVNSSTTTKRWSILVSTRNHISDVILPHTTQDVSCDRVTWSFLLTSLWETHTFIATLFPWKPVTLPQTCRYLSAISANDWPATLWVYPSSFLLLKILNKRLLIVEGSELNVYVYNYMHTRRSVQEACCLKFQINSSL